MRADLLIKSGEVVIPGQGLWPADVAISDGKVAALLEAGTSVEARRVVDASGRLVLPGVIDAHTHLTLGPGCDGYESETRSAAIGGVATSLSYLLDSGDLAEVVQRDIDAGGGRSCGDYGLHPALVTDDQLAAFPDTIDKLGIPSFKFFMTFRGEEGAYIGIPGNDDGFLFRLLRMVAGLPGSLPCIHAENVELVWALGPEAQRDGDGTIRDWDANRPDFVEAEATRRVLYLAEVAGAPIYVVHITCRAALEAVREAKARRPSMVFGETCVHYLSLTCDTAPSPVGKVNPPLRHADDVEALWEGVADGTIDVVGSDHVCRKLASKEGDIWKATSGFPGVATLVPLFLTEGTRRGLDVARLVDKMTAAPAAIFGLAPRKGSLMPGTDGDVTIVDPEARKVIRAAELGSFSDYSPYEGRQISYTAAHTILRGQVIAEDGAYVGKPGVGGYVPRTRTGVR
ncbi:MAG: amidohydrolase family protein [Rhodospirillales bacterium]|jgi:dihydropyrimidinase|nr:amidohydrolase family protein [Rhodospirillales bacterium]HJO71758.1 amidohydrolase family protein [Rhodospirillales bacterium]